MLKSWINTKTNQHKNNQLKNNQSNSNYLEDVIWEKIYFDPITFLKFYSNYKLIEKTSNYATYDINTCIKIFKNMEICKFEKNKLIEQQLHTKIFNSTEFMFRMFNKFLNHNLNKTIISDPDEYKKYYSNAFQLLNSSDLKLAKLCFDYYELFVENTIDFDSDSDSDNINKVTNKLDSFNNEHKLSVQNITNDIEQVLGLFGYDYENLEKILESSEIYVDNHNKILNFVCIKNNTIHYEINKIFKFLIDIIAYHDIQIFNLELVDNVLQSTTKLIFDISDKERFYEFCFNNTTKSPNELNFHVIETKQNNGIPSNLFKGLSYKICKDLLEKISKYNMDLNNYIELKIDILWKSFTEYINQDNFTILDKILDDKISYNIFKKFILFKLSNIKYFENKLDTYLVKLEEKKLRLKNIVK